MSREKRGGGTYIMNKLLTFIFLVLGIFTFNLEATCDSLDPDFEQFSDWNDQLKLRSSLQRQAVIEFKDDIYRDEILKYIDMVLDDGILDDPEAYLHAWSEARGLTREFRIPEDPAHYFFLKYLIL